MSPENEHAEACHCWREHIAPIVEFADVGVRELGITRAEALAVLQVMWIQHVVELLAGDAEEEEEGEEWKRPV